MEDRAITAECCEAIALLLDPRLWSETGGKRLCSGRTTALVMLVYWQQGTCIDVNGKEQALDPSTNKCRLRLVMHLRRPHYLTMQLLAPQAITPCIWAAWYMIPRAACVLPSSFGSRSHLRQLTTFYRRPAVHDLK